MIYTQKQHRRANIFAITAAFFFSLLGGLFFSVPLLTKKTLPPYYLYVIIVGALLTMAGLFFYFTRRYRRRKKLLTKPFPAEWEAFLRSKVTYYSGLNETEKQRFRQQVQIFLDEKLITPIETKISLKEKILVAASAIIPVFSFPEWEYDNLSEVLVYPANFDMDYNFSGKDANILGMVTGQGTTMVLSKTALEHGFDIDNDKLNVGFHEFIHKVDGQDGAIDGIPAACANRKVVKRWIEIADRESKLIAEGKSDINPYALTNRAEFFAVASEYFFENPDSMSNKHPDLYKVLQEIFRQDTKNRFKSIVRSMIRPYGKKAGRNSPCPCGSGKKYKYCCLKKKIF